MWPGLKRARAIGRYSTELRVLTQEKPYPCKKSICKWKPRWVWGLQKWVNHRKKACLSSDGHNAEEQRSRQNGGQWGSVHEWYRRKNYQTPISFLSPLPRGLLNQTRQGRVKFILFQEASTMCHVAYIYIFVILCNPEKRYPSWLPFSTGGKLTSERWSNLFKGPELVGGLIPPFRYCVCMCVCVGMGGGG